MRLGEEKENRAKKLATEIAQMFPKTEVARISRADAGRRFQKTYMYDPVAWAHDMIRWKPGEGLTDYQENILANIPIKKRVCVRAPHGAGKTGLSAITLLWFATTRDGLDWKAITTASAWRQLIKFFWPEVHKWSRHLRWDKLGRPPFNTRTELMIQSLKLKTGEAFAAASDDHQKIEGAHADHILYVFDESKAIIPATFDAAEGAFSGAGEDTGREAYALAISTPGEPNGRFYEIQEKKPGFEDWWPRWIQLEETIRAKRNSQTWADARKRQWGATSAVYRNRVLGEFASGDDDGVIPLSWVELANERWLEWKEKYQEGEAELPAFTVVGADIADGGTAKTVLALRHGPIIAELRPYEGIDQMEAAGRIMGVLRKYQKDKGSAIVDSIGVGAGVVSRLRELRADVFPFNAGERTELTDQSGENKFLNKRAAAWWGLREKLDPHNGYDICLPPDEMLTGDLTAPKYKMTSAGKYQIEAKDDIAKRIDRSTDYGDAVVMAFFEADVSEFEMAYGFFTPSSIQKIADERAGKQPDDHSSWESKVEPQEASQVAQDSIMWGQAERDGRVTGPEEAW